MPLMMDDEENTLLKELVNSGVAPEELTPSNMMGAQKMLIGSKSLVDQGLNPEVDDPKALKVAADQSEAEKPDSPQELTSQQLIAKAIVGLAPALIGFLAGGASGGAVGAQAGMQGLQVMSEAEEQKRKQQEKIAQIKASQEARLAETKQKEKQLAEDRSFKEKLLEKELKGKKEIVASANQAKSEKEMKAATQDLRKEYTSLPVTKATQEVQAAYAKIQNIDDSAAGDLSLIFAYMKMLDPGSTVREGEQATAQNARGVPDAIMGLYNKIRTGEKLVPAQRADFIAQAENLMNSQMAVQKSVDEQFAKFSQRIGADPSQVIVSFSPTFSPETQKKMEERTAARNAPQKPLHNLMWPIGGVNSAVASPAAQKPPFGEMSASELDEYLKTGKLPAR